jgi:hypothetical protein
VNRYSAGTRRILAIALITVLVAYFILVFVTYLQLTPSSSLWPAIGRVDRLLFGGPPPVSRMQRLIESAEGPMSRGGTMRPAFTDQSLGWEALTPGLSAEQKAALLADREGERLAVLDWLHSGAGREPYESDCYHLSATAGVHRITADYLYRASDNEVEPAVIRVRTLLRDRCVTCHGENGRHDIARFIELDTYDRLLPHLEIEPEDTTGRGWLIGALLGLLPLAAISSSLFWHTEQQRAARAALSGLTLASLGSMIGCWLVGSYEGLSVVLLLATAATAAFAVMVQLVAVVCGLLAPHRAK